MYRGAVPELMELVPRIVIVAEELADLIVRTESECSDESGDEYLSVLVYSYLIDVVYVRLILKPCAAVRVDCA